MFNEKCDDKPITPLGLTGERGTQCSHMTQDTSQPCAAMDPCARTAVSSAAASHLVVFDVLAALFAVTDLIGIVHNTSTAAGRKLLASTSCGGGGIPSPTVLSASDFVLVHGNGQQPAGITRMIDTLKAMPAFQAGPKPIVFNEDGQQLPSMPIIVPAHSFGGTCHATGPPSVPRMSNACRLVDQMTAGCLAPSCRPRSLGRRLGRVQYGGGGGRRGLVGFPVLLRWQGPRRLLDRLSMSASQLG